MNFYSMSNIGEIVGSLEIRFQKLFRKMESLQETNQNLLIKLDQSEKVILNQSQEIKDIKSSIKDTEDKWLHEKKLLQDIQTDKSEMDRLRVESEQAEQIGDLEKIAKIRYGLVPNLKKSIDDKLSKLVKTSASSNIIYSPKLSINNPKAGPQLDLIR